MTFIPYLFQLHSVRKVHEFGGNALLSFEMGLGKTPSSLLYAYRNPHLCPIVVVCPASIKEQWKRECKLHFDWDARILDGTTPFPHEGEVPIVTIVNYDILIQREGFAGEGWLNYLKSINPQLVIVDECFPYETMVQTEHGMIPIGKIVEEKIATKVASYDIANHQFVLSPIKNYFKIRRNTKMVVVKHRKGVLHCTENHKIWTRNRGYVEAINLRIGDQLQDLSDVQKEFSSISENQEILFSTLYQYRKQRAKERKSRNRMSKLPEGVLRFSLPFQRKEKKDLLQSGLRYKMACQTTRFQKKIHQREVGTTQTNNHSISEYSSMGGTKKKNQQENVGKQSRIKTRSGRKDEEYQKEEWDATYLERRTWWEREVYFPAGISVGGIVLLDGWVGEGVTNSDLNEKRIWISNKLQSGCGESREENSNRNRRKRTQSKKSQRKGQEETRVPGKPSTVESVEILQPEDRQGSICNSTRDTFVYCIEVEHTHNFFADRILVSNCQYISSRKAKRSVSVKELCQYAPSVLCLSGTPLANRPMELWQILNLLRPDLYPNFFKFGLRYCNGHRNKWGWDFTGTSNLEELHEQLLKNVMIRYRKCDVIDQLPDKQRCVVPFALPSRKEYNAELKAFIKDLKKGKMSKMDKQGGLFRLKHLAGLAKLPCIIEWVNSYLENSEGKLLLFAMHHDVMEPLHQEFKKHAVLIHGGITGKHRQKAVDDFQTNPKKRICIGQMQAAGVGLNLTAAHDVAFAELAWRPADMIQAEDRAYARLSDIHGINSWYLIAKDTIEERLLEMNQTKQQIADAVLDGGAVNGTWEVYDLLCEQLLAGGLLPA